MGWTDIPEYELPENPVEQGKPSTLDIDMEDVEFSTNNILDLATRLAKGAKPGSEHALSVEALKLLARPYCVYTNLAVTREFLPADMLIGLCKATAFFLALATVSSAKDGDALLAANAVMEGLGEDYKTLVKGFIDGQAEKKSLAN